MGVDSNQTVFITNTSGFIESWMAKELLSKGKNVVAGVTDINNLGETQHLVELAQRLPGHIQIREVDYNSPTSIDKALKGCNSIVYTTVPFDCLLSSKHSASETFNRLQQLLPRVNSNLKSFVLCSSSQSLQQDSLQHDYFKKIEMHCKRHFKANSTQLSIIYSGFAFGPALSKHHKKQNRIIKFLSSNKVLLGVPDISVGIVDVRDLALTVSNSIDKKSSSENIITIARNIGMVELSQSLKKMSPKLPIANKKLSWKLARLFSPILGIDRFILKEKKIATLPDKRKGYRIIRGSHSLESTLADQFAASA